MILAMPCKVDDLLPHTPPMILLDQVLSCTDNKVITTINITPDSPFYVAAGVPSYVGLEYMAQTCGVYAGVEALRHNRKVRLGYLLGTRNYSASAGHFKPGEPLTCEATELLRQDGMGVFECKILRNNEVIASAQLNLYQPEDGAIEGRR